MSVESDYNGWRNWETWNFNLQLNNDEFLYKNVWRFSDDYEEVIRRLKIHGITELDGMSIEDPDVDIDQINEALNEE